ncbi:hypothetical protein [Moorena sp. SIO4G3]|nr:hypothetical protein [Moorena sp. SIO4G3]NEO80176.1 hypothetical protein [Moorena sp. SIO4G3]
MRSPSLDYHKFKYSVSHSYEVNIIFSLFPDPLFPDPLFPAPCSLLPAP